MSAECAAAQGRFAVYHDSLFADQADIGTRSWNEFAKAAGVPNIPAFQQCVDAMTYQDRVASDMQAGKSLKLGGTPAVIVDGKLYEGAPPVSQVEEWIKAAR
jgi:protein-disulfide isomerase